MIARTDCPMLGKTSLKKLGETASQGEHDGLIWPTRSSKNKRHRLNLIMSCRTRHRDRGVRCRSWDEGPSSSNLINKKVQEAIAHFRR